MSTLHYPHVPDSLREDGTGTETRSGHLKNRPLSGARHGRRQKYQEDSRDTNDEGLLLRNGKD